MVHLSPGQIFREEMTRNSALGRRVKAYVTSGRLVPNALVVQVMSLHLGKTMRAKRDFVLDGFPRTKGQAVGLSRVLRRRGQPLDGAIYLTSPPVVLVRRLSGRRVCAKCGANYHLRTMTPRRPGRCDRCRGLLVIRKDDQPDTIRKRLAIDRKSAAPLLAYYRRQGLLCRLNGAGRIDRVFRRAITLFRRQGWLERGFHRF